VTNDLSGALARSSRQTGRGRSEVGSLGVSAISHTGGKPLAAYLQSTSAHEIAELRLGKKTEALNAQAEKLAASSAATPYDTPPVRFIDTRSIRPAPPACRSSSRAVVRPSSTATLYRDLVKGGIKRTHEELEAKAATVAKEKKTARCR
jgi:hypothetical protein